MGRRLRGLVSRVDMVALVPYRALLKGHSRAERHFRERCNVVVSAGAVVFPCICIFIGGECFVHLCAWEGLEQVAHSFYIEVVDFNEVLLCFGWLGYVVLGGFLWGQRPLCPCASLISSNICPSGNWMSPVWDV